MGNASHFKVPTKSAIRDRMNAAVRNTMEKHDNPVKVAGEGDDIYDMNEAFAAEFHEAYGHQSRAVDEAFPSTAGFENLVRHGRRFIGGATVATVAEGTGEGDGAFKATGTIGETWAIGATLVHDVSGQRYITTNAGMLVDAGDGTGEGYVQVEAIEAGDAGALVDGETVRWETLPDGFDLAATVDGDMEGGSDAETKEHYLQRLQDYFDHPEAGGTLEDFRQWALQVDGIGFAAAFCLRLGEVDVAVLDMEGEAVSDAVLADVQTKIDEERPETAYGSTAVKPTITSVDLTFQLRLDAAYAFSDTPDAVTAAGCSKTAIKLDITGAGAAALDFQVGDWIAIVGLQEAREISAVDTTNNILHVRSEFSEAPAAADDIIPGCPTYDQLAQAIVDQFATLQPGDTYYKDGGEWSLRNNPEVLSVLQTSPTGNVTAQVDEVEIQVLRLGDLIMEAMGS